MATDTVTIAEFVKTNGITITSEYADRNPNMDGSADMDNYKCTLTRRANRKEVDTGNGIAVILYGRRLRMTLYFSKGIGLHGEEPTAEEVLSCLASDSAGIENARGFEDFCNEYGYDTDSRKAEKTYKTCEHQAKRLRNFLGDDLYDRLLWHTEGM